MTNPTELLADRLAAGSALYDPQDRKLAVAALRAFGSPPSDVDISKIGRDSANRIMALHTPPSDVGGRSDMAMLADEIEDQRGKDLMLMQGDRDLIVAALRQSTPSPGRQDEREAIAPYDAGLLNNFGGGDVQWWQDYIRELLRDAYDHYVEQTDALLSRSPAPGNGAAMREALEPFAKIAPFIEFTDLRDGEIVHRQYDRDGNRHEISKDDFRRAAKTYAALSESKR